MLSMKNINKTQLEILKRRLNSQIRYALPLKEQRFFLIGIADYVKIIEDSECLSEIVSTHFTKEQRKVIQKMKGPFEDAYKESVQIFEAIRLLIKKHNADDQELERLISNHKDYLSGKLQYEGAINLTIGVLENLKNMLIVLKSKGYDVNDFAVFDEKGNLTNWKMASTEKRLNELLLQYNKLREVSIWGDWEKIWFLYVIFYLQEDSDSVFDYMKEQMECGVLYGENIAKIKNSKGTLSDIEKKMLIISTAKIHDRLILEIDNLILELEDKTKEEVASKPQGESNFRYDSEGAMLFYKDDLVLNMHKNNSGRAKIFNTLWIDKRIMLNNTIIEKGKPAILRANLRRISGYSTNENIDKAVAFFRGKLGGLPIEIIAEKGFRLIIKD